MQRSAIDEDRIATIMANGRTRAEAERIVDAPVPPAAKWLTILVVVALAGTLAYCAISVFH